MGYVLQVLLKRISEDVASGSVRHEIKVLAASWVGDCLQRRLAGIGNGPRREALDDVGVVGRGLIEIGPRDRAAERALAEREPVNDGRIGLEPHTFLQPVDEDAGDPRALVGFAGLLLDDRGEDDHFAGRFDRQVGRAPLPDFIDQFGLLFLHARYGRLSVKAAREVVSLGQNRPLARGLLDVASEKFSVTHPADDLLARQSFGDR